VYLFGGCSPENSNTGIQDILLFIYNTFFSFMQIRSDTSEIQEETVPFVKDKVMEMNHIYAKVDKLEVCSLH
uniref:Uncharacterized protein n=1 Tax=Calidris pygmaea TaxID=425635 RepID=A0A8C3JML3_9CHAR